MKLIYRWNEELITILESPSGVDTEFQIKILSDHPPYIQAMRQVQKHFETNRVITDVNIYAYQNHEYRIIVRMDYYTEFVLELMKYQLLLNVEWVSLA